MHYVILCIVLCLCVASSYSYEILFANTTRYSNTKEKPHFICVIARLRNIASLLPQWLEYHIIAGVDYFIFADDCSDDLNHATMFWMEFYKAFGYVHIFYTNPFSNCSNHIPNENPVLNMTAHFAKTICDWTFAFDPDEYIYPVDNIANIDEIGPVNFMKNVVANVSVDWPVVRLPWLIMSSLGIEQKPNKLVIDAYPIGRFAEYIKTGINSSKLIDWFNPHHPDVVESEIVKYGTYYHEFVMSKHIHANNLSDICPPINFEDPERDINSERFKYHYIKPGEVCNKPCKSSLYIRHFRGLSWEDYRDIRGSRKYIANGARSFKVPRHRWYFFNITFNGCNALPDDGGKFHNLIAEEVLNRSYLRLSYYRKHMSGGDVNSSISEWEDHVHVFRDQTRWLHGEVLSSNL